MEFYEKTNLFTISNSKTVFFLKKQMAWARGIPSRSPMQVLTTPDVA